MALKLIAVDMDGTFLNDEKQYDREWFLKQYKKMKEQDIHFVVASGNQYYQLKSFFDDIQDEISYVAENGAYVVDRGEEVFAADIPKHDVKLVVEELALYDRILTVLCGKESAYILDEVPQQFFDEINKYYRRLKRVESFEQVDDQILKFALTCPLEETIDLRDYLQSKIGNLVTPVSSGHGSIDLIDPSYHKAHGIRLLQEKWAVQDYESMAFGDGGNDIEMLKHVTYGFGMENGSEDVKQLADYIALANNHNGVLKIIDQYFAKEGPFNSIC